MPKNPGGIARYGWRIVTKDGDELQAENGEVCRGHGATNNIAEWAALTHGLRYLKQNKWIGSLEIYGDSQLVIKQLNGEYKVKKKELAVYHQECVDLLQKLNWSANWIPREKNQECDNLSKK